MSYADDLREEKRYMEKIYSAFDSRIEKSMEAEQKAKAYYHSGSFENQETQIVASEASRAEKYRQRDEQLIAALYNEPYFAHIRMYSKDEQVHLDCFLSDKDELEEYMPIDSLQETYIIPFKKDRNRPFLDAAYHCYQAKTEEEIPVSVRDDRTWTLNTNIYQPELIRKVDIYRRQLQSVFSYLPQSDQELLDLADEVLARKLDENRSNPKLRNIIATLQQEQFDIVRIDLDKDFVVQGCAGSGKTQVLIHRLFYLRDYLSESGWDKVLLITPTQLFRNYANELMHRYRLKSINNTSLAGFYQTILDCFDPRFSERQYLFETTEEYLPDAYLVRAYDRSLIETIEAEIEKAILRYVSDGCRLIDIDMPHASAIDIDFVNTVSHQLSQRIQEFDKAEKLLSDDEEYQNHRRELEEFEKQLRPLQKKLQTLATATANLKKDKETFDDLNSAYEKAKADADDVRRDSENRLLKLSDRIRQCINELDSGADTKDPTLMASFAQLRGYLLDDLDAKTDDAKARKEFQALLNSISDKRRAALLNFTKGLSPDKWYEKLEKLIQANEKQVQETMDEVTLTNLFIEDLRKWFNEHDFENVQNQRKEYRAELERIRHFLSRIESAIFENEVWNALAPLKTQYGIKTIHIEQVKDGREKRSRILYKSDLLFYLKIYDRLRRHRTLPEYTMICIDEGQDLHSADYTLIRALYPNSVLNVFGDTGQVLHEACGVSDWIADTGIQEVYELKRNYRNKVAIVEFCNKKFGSDMGYIKLLNEDFQNSVVELTQTSQIDTSLMLMGSDMAVIVKNKQMFDELRCLVMDDSTRYKLYYLDTKAEKVPEDVIPCYSIFAAKGLEFKTVLVYAQDMTPKQKMVACTRAMDKLFYYGE